MARNRQKAAGEGLYKRIAKVLGIPPEITDESVRFARRSEVRGNTRLNLATSREEQGARIFRDMPLPRREVQ